MNPRADPLLIRPPAAMRAYVTVFLVFWVGAVVWTTIVRHHQASSVAIGALFIAFGCALGYRLLRLGARVGADGVLVVSNHFGTRRLERAEVEEFRAGINAGSGWNQKGAQALLRDGTYFGIDVCRAPFGLGNERLTRQVKELNEWLGQRWPEVGS